MLEKAIFSERKRFSLLDAWGRGMKFRKTYLAVAWYFFWMICLARCVHLNCLKIFRRDFSLSYRIGNNVGCWDSAAFGCWGHSHLKNCWKMLRMILQSSPIERRGKQSKVRASPELCALQLSTHLTLTTTLGGGHYCFLCQGKNLDKLDFLLKCWICCMVFGAKCCSPFQKLTAGLRASLGSEKAGQHHSHRTAFDEKKKIIVKEND